MSGDNPKIIILFGAPYSGKGTQATALVESFDLAQISTGHLLRMEAEQDTERGRFVKECSSKFGSGAGYVSDDIVIALVFEEMMAKADKQGFVFDGFPRTFQQAQMLNALLKEKGWVATVFELQVPQEELLKRALSRMICQPCQRNYTVADRERSTQHICSFCCRALTRRLEDTADHFPHRLSEYQKKTMPVLDLYREMGVLKPVDGMAPIDVVSRQILQLIR